MRNVKRSVLALVLVVLLIAASSATFAARSNFVPLGTGISHTYDSIPFQIDGVHIAVSHNAHGSYWEPFTEVATYNLSGYTTDKVHLIVLAAWATAVPDDVIVGHINIYYTDSTSTPLDLICGVNIAEWAYDRPENQPYLQHTKIPPAYSFWTDIDSEYFYWGHFFYVSIDTEEKPLDYLELVLDPASYTMDFTDTFGICINAITLEVVLVEATIDINPDTLNLKSKGKWITCYIELPEGYDVNDIAIDAILLEDVMEVQHSDVQDGVLMVKFDRQDVIAYIESLGLKLPADVTLTVTGELIGGTSFEGSDTIRVIDKGK